MVPTSQELLRVWLGMVAALLLSCAGAPRRQPQSSEPVECEIDGLYVFDSADGRNPSGMPNRVYLREGLLYIETLHVTSISSYDLPRTPPRRCWDGEPFEFDVRTGELTVPAWSDSGWAQVRTTVECERGDAERVPRGRWFLLREDGTAAVQRFRLCTGADNGIPGGPCNVSRADIIDVPCTVLDEMPRALW